MSRQWMASSTGGRRTTLTFENFRGLDGFGFSRGPAPTVPAGFVPRVHNNMTDPTYGRVVLGTRYNYSTLLGLEGFCAKCVISDNFNDSCVGDTICHQVYFPTEYAKFPDGFRMMKGVLNGKTWLPLHVGDQRDCLVSACFGMDETFHDRSHIHVVHRCTTYAESGDTCRCNGFDNFRPHGISFIRSYQMAGPDDGRSIVEWMSTGGRQVIEFLDAADVSRCWSQSMGSFPEHDDCFTDAQGTPIGTLDRPLSLNEDQGWPTVCDFPSGGLIQE